MKNDEAKKLVVKKIKEVFGENFIGESNKKYYVWIGAGADRTQVAISLTVPKIPVEKVTLSDYDFESSDNFEVAPTKFEPSEITQEEKDNIEKLAKMLGL